MTKLIVLILAAALFALLMLSILRTRDPEPLQTDWKREAAGPTDSLRVYWLGHSLVNARDTHAADPADLMESVGRMAAANGLSYSHFDHTIYGAPLSLLWRGRPHSYDRSEPEMPVRLETLLREGASFDAMVLTEGLPVAAAMRAEHSAWYAQQFACALRARNPAARVYVYESWSHLGGSDPQGGYPSVSVFDWGARIEADRAHWERLADLAATGRVSPPGFAGWIERVLGGPREPRAGAGPIFLVPVGTAMLRLARELRAERWEFEGRALALSDLFSNPYTSWPDGWPLQRPLAGEAERQALAALPLRHPDEPHDDIHPSDLGVYFGALVHYATLYRRTPIGLPPMVAGLPPDTARKLQQLVWDVVRNDPRTGVAAD